MTGYIVEACAALVAAWIAYAVGRSRSTAADFTAGLLAGRAEAARTAAQRPPTTPVFFGATVPPEGPLPAESDQCSHPADFTPGADGSVGRSGAEIPAWLRAPNSSERSA